MERHIAEDYPDGPPHILPFVAEEYVKFYYLDNNDVWKNPRYHCLYYQLEYIKSTIITTPNGEKTTPMEAYVQENWKALDIYLDDNKINQRARDLFHCLLMHYATIRGNLKLIQFLYNKLMVETSKRNGTWTPVRWFLNQDTSTKIIQRKIQEKAYNHSNAAFQVMHMAAEKGHFHLVKFLIDRGYDINFRNKRDLDTPLHDAIQNKQMKMARFLINNGANIYAHNIHYQTPLSYIEGEEKRKELRKLFFKYQGIY